MKTGTNTLVVAVQDLNDGRVPSGKSGPRGDYTFCSGIWQSVWLEPVNKNYIENIRLLPEPASNRLKLFVKTRGTGKITATALDGKEWLRSQKRPMMNTLSADSKPETLVAG